MAVLNPVSRALELPEELQRELRLLRDHQLRAVNRSVSTFSVGLRIDADRLIEQIQRLHGQPEQIARLLEEFHLEHTRDRAAAAVGATAAIAVTSAQRYGEILAKVPQPVAGFPTPARASQLSARLTGAGRVEAKTAGDRTALRWLKRYTPTPTRTALHGQAMRTAGDARRVVVNSIGEQQALSETSRDAIRVLRGSKAGQLEELPKLVERIRTAGRRLSANTGSRLALKEWQASRNAIGRTQRRLKDGARVQNAYIELLQDVSRWGPQQVDRAVDKWTFQKSRFHAERWIRTETLGAARAEQLKQDRARPWVVGYIWRLNRGVHSKAVRARWPKGRPKRGRGRAVYCVCERMNGQRFSRAILEQYPRGGHPHCSCTFEPIYDRFILAHAPPIGGGL